MTSGSSSRPMLSPLLLSPSRKGVSSPLAELAAMSGEYL